MTAVAHAELPDQAPTIDPGTEPVIVTIASRKGGVGKSTLTANLAVALAATGAQVIAVDLDGQGNLTHALTGTISHELTVVDLLSNPHQDVFAAGPVPGVKVIPSGIGRLDEAQDEISRGTNGHKRLAEAIRTAVSSQPAQYVLIDTPPSFGPLLMAALATADFAIAPVDKKSHWSANGAADVQGYVDKARATGRGRAVFAGVVLNQVPARARKVAKAVADDMVAAGTDVSEALIPDLKEAPEGEYLGTPGYLHEGANRKWVKAFDQLASEIVYLRRIWAGE